MYFVYLLIILATFEIGSVTRKLYIILPNLGKKVAQKYQNIFAQLGLNEADTLESSSILIY